MESFYSPSGASPFPRHHLQTTLHLPLAPPTTTPTDLLLTGRHLRSAPARLHERAHSILAVVATRALPPPPSFGKPP